jgi:hypothetical protein
MLAALAVEKHRAGAEFDYLAGRPGAAEYFTGRAVAWRARTQNLGGEARNRAVADVVAAGDLAHEHARRDHRQESRFPILGRHMADTTTPHGRLILTVLGGLAEFERVRPPQLPGGRGRAGIVSPIREFEFACLSVREARDRPAPARLLLPVRGVRTAPPQAERPRVRGRNRSCPYAPPSQVYPTRANDHHRHDRRCPLQR